MVDADKMLGYFADSLSMGSGVSVDAGDGRGVWEVREDDLASGVLAAQTAQEVLDAFFAAHPSLVYGSRNVPVAIALRHLRFDKTDEREPVLLVRAALDAHGYLHTVDKVPYWIPPERVGREEVPNEALTLCDIDTYRTYQYALSALPADGGFAASVRHATSMFDAGLDIDTLQLDLLGAHIDPDRPTIRICEGMDGFLDAASVLIRCAYDASAHGDAALNVPLRRILGVSSAIIADASVSRAANGGGQDTAPADARAICGADREGVGASGGTDAVPPAGRAVVQGVKDTLHDAFPNDPLIAHKLFCGMPAGVYDMDEARRKSVSSVGATLDDDAFLLRVEAGEDRVGMAVALAANIFTEAALRGDRAPATAIVASRETLGHVAALLAGRPSVPHASPCTRWVPRVARDGRAEGATVGQQSRVLGPLQTLCSFADSADDVRQRGDAMTPDGLGPEADGCPLWAIEVLRAETLAFDPRYPRESPLCAYGQEWYVREATSYFLDRVSAFFGKRVHDLGKAQAMLSERLRLIDQLRTELIDAQDSVCRASGLLLERDALTDEVANLRGRHAALRERLAYWEDMRESGAARSTLAGLAPQLEEAFVHAHAEPDEGLAQGLTAIDEVVDAYVAEIVGVQDRIAAARDRISGLMYGTRIADEQGVLAARLLARVITLCRLDAAQTAELETVADSGALSLEMLEGALDHTVRSTEFWLAVHVFEGRWLARCGQAPDFSGAVLSTTRSDIGARAELLPFFLLPDDVACALDGTKEADDAEARAPEAEYADRHGCERREQRPCRSASPLRCAILPEAGRASVPQAAALLALCDRSVLMGSELEYCVRPPLGPISDVVRMDRFLTRKERVDARSWGLCASGHTSAYLTLRRQGAPLCGDLPSRAAVTLSEGYVVVPDSFWETVASSRRNIAEAFALARWLKRHAESIRTSAKELGRPATAVLTPYVEQARLVKEIVDGILTDLAACLEVRVVDGASCGTWAHVIVSTVSSPAELVSDYKGVLAPLIGRVEVSAREDVTWFMGPQWRKSKESCLRELFGRTRRIGRLYAFPHRGRASTDPQAQVETESKRGSEPLALEEVISQFQQRGELEGPISAQEALGRLASAGLVTPRLEGETPCGWEPSRSGAEVGVVALTQDDGLASLGFTPQALPAVALAFSFGA